VRFWNVLLPSAVAVRSIGLCSKIWRSFYGSHMSAMEQCDPTPGDIIKKLTRYTIARRQAMLTRTDRNHLGSEGAPKSLNQNTPGARSAAHCERGTTEMANATETEPSAQTQVDPAAVRRREVEASPGFSSTRWRRTNNGAAPRAGSGPIIWAKSLGALGVAHGHFEGLRGAGQADSPTTGVPISVPVAPHARAHHNVMGEPSTKPARFPLPKRAAHPSADADLREQIDVSAESSSPPASRSSPSPSLTYAKAARSPVRGAVPSAIPFSFSN